MRRRLTTEQLTQALAFKLAFHGQLCMVHDDPAECELPLQVAHVIPKQALRRRRLDEYVYDARNGILVCYRAHRRSDAGLERFPVDRLPDSVWEFAAELGLEWYVERLYGARAAA